MNWRDFLLSVADIFPSGVFIMASNAPIPVIISLLFAGMRIKYSILTPTLIRRLTCGNLSARARSHRLTDFFSDTVIQSSGQCAVSAIAAWTATFAMGSVMKVMGLMHVKSMEPLISAARPTAIVVVVLVVVVMVSVVDVDVVVVVVVEVDVVEVVVVTVVVRVSFWGR